MTETNNEVAIIENSLGVLQSAPEILLESRERKEKAVTVGRNILSTIQESGMNSETDARAMSYIVNVSKASAEMKEKRSAVTQIMDTIKKMYTEVENDLDVKKSGTVPNQIQAYRDQYAKEVAEKRRAEEKRLQQIADKQKEAIELKYKAEQRLYDYYNAYLLKIKNGIRGKFNEITLCDFEEKSTGLQSYNPEYKEDHFNAFTGELYSPTGLNSTEDIDAIRAEVMEGKFMEFSANYQAELLSLRDELIGELPSKLADLREHETLRIEAEDLKKQQESEKNEQEKLRLKKLSEEAEQRKLQADADQKKREQEANDKLLKEAEEKAAEEKESLAIKQQGEETMVMFEQQAAVAESAQAPDARTGFEITVLHPVGFTQIFAMWFEKVGKDLPIDKIGNTKLDQMKAWAEKIAKTDGTKIESKFIKYEDSYKAVNKKAKAE